MAWEQEVWNCFKKVGHWQKSDAEKVEDGGAFKNLRNYKKKYLYL